jgi:hypothetical protein
MPGPTGFKIAAIVPQSRPVSPVTRVPERIPVSAPANVAALDTAVTGLRHALADLRAQARETQGASPVFEPRAVSPTASHWRAGYQAGLSGHAAVPPQQIANLLDREARLARMSWQEGYAQGFRTLKAQSKLPSVAVAKTRTSIVDRGIPFRAWPAGVGPRPPLSGAQVRLMSQAAVQNYHALGYSEVPVAED